MSAGAPRPDAPAPAPEKRVADPRKVESRRRFLATCAVGAGAVGLGLAGLLPAWGGRLNRLRPPGALDERDFLAACIKCGQCVQVCPVNALRVGPLKDGAGLGAPYIDARRQACDFACDVGQCILACPTGALAYHKPDFFPVREGAALEDPPVLLAKRGEPDAALQFRERMGLAKLARPEACLSVKGEGVKGPARPPPFRGKKRYAEVDRWKPLPVKEHDYELERCDLCVRECPIEGAISIEDKAGPGGAVVKTPVVSERCVGCGVCEMVCPAEPAAIVVEPRATWEGAS